MNGEGVALQTTPLHLLTVVHQGFRGMEVVLPSSVAGHFPWSHFDCLTAVERPGANVITM